MICPNCNQNSSGNGVVCLFCGAALDVACPQCGRPVTPGSRFCSHCGEALSKASRHLGETLAVNQPVVKDRPLTPLVGRSHELELIFESLKEVGRQGRFITIQGEAGMGKSRLLLEVGALLEPGRFSSLVVNGQSSGSYTPYLPFITAIRNLLQLDEEYVVEGRMQRVKGALLGLDPALERHLPLLFHLLSMRSSHFDQYLLPEMKGDEMRQAIHQALYDLVGAATRAHPLMLVLEDLHWLDEASDSALRYLLERMEDLPLAVLATYRPSYLRDWPHLACHLPINLSKLDQAHTAAIIAAQLGVPEVPAGLARSIHSKSRGNPFFVEELCWGLREDGVVSVENGHLVMKGNIQANQLPATVQEAIQGRMGRLDSRHRDTLGLASVLGNQFSSLLLDRVAGQAGMESLLEGLSSKNLIQPAEKEGEYMFKHALIQEAAYGGLMDQRKMALHAMVGQALEELYSDNLEEYLEPLANHFVNAGSLEKALQYLEMAGDKASSIHSLEEARSHFERAVQLLVDLEQTEENRRRLVELNIKWAAASFYSPREVNLAGLEQAIPLAEALGDQVLLVRAVAWTGRLYYILGNLAKAMPYFTRTIELAKELDDHELLALPYNIIGRLGVFTTQYDKGIEYLNRGMELLTGDHHQAEYIYSASMLSVNHCLKGQVSEAMAAEAKALSLARESEDLSVLSGVMVRAGLVRSILGSWEEAIPQCQEGIKLAHKVGNAILEGIGQCAYGYALFMSGDLYNGLEMMGKGIGRIEKTGSRISLSLFYAWMGELNAMSGMREEAMAFAQKSLALAPFNERSGEMDAHRVLAMAAALETPPDWELMEREMAQCLELGQKIGSGPLLAVSHFRYGVLLKEKGEAAKGDEQLALAEEMFGRYRIQ